MVSQCEECIRRLPSQSKEPEMHEIPSCPMDLVYVDLFQYAGLHYLVMVDRYSGWPCVQKLRTGTNSREVCQVLSNWFADFGVPVRLNSDGGPQFRSSKFEEWCMFWGILHSMSSSYYPQSNGAAEAASQVYENSHCKSYR